MDDKSFFNELTKFKGRKEPLHETSAVLSYETGRLLEQAMYLYWGTHDVARMGLFKSELIDVVAQVILICQSIGVDFADMREMGIEKALERFTGKERK